MLTYNSVPYNFSGYPELLFANRKDIRMIEVGKGRQSHQVIVKVCILTKYYSYLVH